MKAGQLITVSQYGEVFEASTKCVLSVSLEQYWAKFCPGQISSVTATLSESNCRNGDINREEIYSYIQQETSQMYTYVL
jgi:hypothetical protein